MLTIHFHRSNTLMGKAIRLITRSDINHTSHDINGDAFESNSKEGVVNKNNKSTIVESISFDRGDDRIALLFCNNQVGKEYDWIGVLSFLWIWLPQKIGAWWCSEFSTVTLMKFLGVRNDYYNSKLSPNDLRLECRKLKSLGL